MKAIIDTRQILYSIIATTQYLYQTDWVKDITTLKNKIMAKKVQIMHFFQSKNDANSIG